MPIKKPRVIKKLSLDRRLKNLSKEKKILLKSNEISKVKSALRERVKFSRADNQIEVISITPIKGGIEVLARAWNTDGTQIGFGADGTVDIERVRIFKTPVLVEDALGTIVRKVSTLDPITNKPVLSEVRYSVNPKKALMQSLTHTIHVKKEVSVDPKRIVRGKVGSTTSTFYSASGDGYVANSNSNFSTCRNSANGNAVNHTATSDGSNTQSTLFASVYYMGRGFIPFDTSALPDTDDISAATFSVYTISVTDADGETYEAVQTSQASTSSLVNADFNNLTFTSGGSRSLGSPAYQDITLNATGRGWISKTGFTKLGTILGGDLSSTAPTGINRDSYYFSENSGTTQDPKLVVEHAAAGGSTSIKSIAGVTQANIKSIQGVAIASISSVAGVSNTS